MKLSNPLLTRAGVLALVLSIAAPAVAGADVFGWRTDDGVFAYTDDPKKIPARYADDAVSVRDTKLDAYPQLTREDSAATRAVSERMQQRLDYLRRLNALDAAKPSPASASRGDGTTVSVATGSPRVPTVDVTAGDHAAPVVVEPILTHNDGDALTRRTTLVRQGDRTIAVIKGRSHHYDVNEDVYDEDDVDAGR